MESRGISGEKGESLTTFEGRDIEFHTHAQLLFRMGENHIKEEPKPLAGRGAPRANDPFKTPFHEK